MVIGILVLSKAPASVCVSKSSVSCTVRSVQASELQSLERQGWRVPLPFYLELEPSVLFQAVIFMKPFKIFTK